MTVRPASSAARHALVDRDVRLAEILAAFAVADDHVLHTHRGEHLGGNFAREGAALRPVAVFGAHADVRALRGLEHDRQIDVRHAAHDAAVCVCDEGLNGLDEFLRLGGRLVHFPVAGDHCLALCFVHCLRMLLPKSLCRVSPREGPGGTFGIFRCQSPDKKGQGLCAPRPFGKCQLVFVIQACDARQDLALEEFEGSAAARGDVRHLIGKAEVLHRSRGVAAADDRNRRRCPQRPSPRRSCRLRSSSIRKRPSGRSKRPCRRP